MTALVHQLVDFKTTAIVSEQMVNNNGYNMNRGLVKTTKEKYRMETITLSSPCTHLTEPEKRLKTSLSAWMASKAETHAKL